MSSNTFKRQVYAGLMEILGDTKYYYDSIAGSDYSGLTPDGVLKVKEWIEIMAPHMLRQTRLELRQLAKDMVLEELEK